MAAVTPSSEAGAASLDHDEFGFETKAVVLNFMGMLPTPTPTNTTSSSSSSGSGGGRHFSTQHSQSSAESHSASWKKKELPDLPEMSIMERFDPSQSEDELDVPVSHEMVSSPSKALKRQSAHDIGLVSQVGGGIGNRHHTYRQSLSVGEDYPPLQSYMKTSPKRQLVKWKTLEPAQSPPHAPEPFKSSSRRLKKSDRPSSLPLPEGEAGFQPQTNSPSPRRSPRPATQPSPMEAHGAVGRQHSSSSEGSDDSFAYSDSSSLYMSGRSLTSASSTYVSVQTADVDSLVKAKTLPAVAVPLRDEICKELLDLERERVESGLSTTPHDSFDGSQASRGASFLPPLSMPSVSVNSQLHSPETQVADYLRIIGDRVNADYGAEIDQVVEGLQPMPREQITYDVLRCLAVQLLQHMGASHSNGWHKVALVMLLGQKITLSLLQRGERGISTLVEYVTRLVMDQAADFVISRGGWHSIAEIMTPMSAADFPHFPLDHESTDTTPSGTDTTGTTVLQNTASSEASYNAGTLAGSATLDSIASISNEGTTSSDYVDTILLQPVEQSGLDRRRRISNHTRNGDYELLHDPTVQDSSSSGDYEHLKEDMGFIRQVSRQLSDEWRREAVGPPLLTLAIGAVGVLLVSWLLYRKMQNV